MKGKEKIELGHFVKKLSDENDIQETVKDEEKEKEEKEEVEEVKEEKDESSIAQKAYE